MSLVYVLRHAEKDSSGNLTEKGRATAKRLGLLLPRFAHVVSSPSQRSLDTARLITGIEPTIDSRADYATAPENASDAINKIAAEQGIMFSEAARLYGDQQVLGGIETKAAELMNLIESLLDGPEGNSLVVTHDLCIAPAMQQRGLPFRPVDYLSGYTINNAGVITPIEARTLLDS